MLAISFRLFSQVITKFIVRLSVVVVESSNISVSCAVGSRAGGRRGRGGDDAGRRGRARAALVGDASLKLSIITLVKRVAVYRKAAAYWEVCRLLTAANPPLYCCSNK